MEPRPAGTVHRVGEDHQRPGQPLGDVGAARHGDAGTGLDGEPPSAADGVAQPDQRNRVDVGERRGVRAGEGSHGRRQSLGVDGPVFQDVAIGPRDQQLAHQVGQHGVVGAGSRGQVAGGQARGLGVARIDDPDLPATGDLADGPGRVRHRQCVAVRDHRVAADVDQEVDAVVVGPAGQPHEPAHQVGDQRLGGAVDGQRAESGGCGDGGLQGLGHPVAGGVHADPGAEEDTDRLRAVAVDDGLQPRGEIVETRLPSDVAQRAVDPQPRVLQAVRVVMQLWQRAALGAGVARRHRMVPVAAHA